MKEKEIKNQRVSRAEFNEMCDLLGEIRREGHALPEGVTIEMLLGEAPPKKTVGNAIEYAGRVAEDDGFWKRLPETIDGVEIDELRRRLREALKKVS